MVRLNVALAGRNRAEKLTCSLVNEFVNAVDAVVQQLDHDTVNGLRQRLKGAYSRVRVPCPFALTRVSVVVAASIRWKGERSGDDQQ